MTAIESATGNLGPSTRHERLWETVEYARTKSPYYGKALADVSRASNVTSLLAQIPVMTRTTATENSAAIRCLRTIPSYVVFTGGSSGAPMLVYGIDPERDFDVRGSPPTTYRRALGVVTGGGHHGEVPIIPGELGVLNLPLRNAENYSWAWRILTSIHQFAGFESHVSYLVWPLPAIKKFTHYVLEQRLPTDELALDLIASYAWYLSRPWRRKISSVLGARVIDHYGFSEIPSTAAECLACGWYHYGADVIAEYVDVEHQPIGDGIGSILVTSLYPFVDDFVLLRYDPGDLIEVGPHCAAAGEAGFRPLGSRRDAWRDRTGQWVLCPAHVAEAVDADPMVGRLADMRFGGITAGDDDSFPRWRSKFDESTGLRVEIEVVFSPALHRAESESLEARVRQSLLSSNRHLESRCADGMRFEVSALEKGAIGDRECVRC